MTSSNRASSIRVGSYQLFERIGEGGTAHVHRAVADDGRTVAVKLLAPQAELDDASARARFDREIRILAGLEHPNVVRLLDHGVDDELGPYLVTPLVPGRNLRDLVAGARLCPEAALLLMQPVAHALAALHGAGLVHRDVKPENVIASPDGQVVLVDLGLAYKRGQTRYTEEGAVVGSVPYMSPEQVEGGDVDAPSDVWSAAVMTYEQLAGKRPFERDRPTEEAAAIMVGAFTPLKAADRRAPPELADLIAECLQRDPRARPNAATLLYRAEALIDWMDPNDAALELAAVIDDPVGYQSRVAPFRVRRLKREARIAIERGEAFAALKGIDRALAYAPDDPELRELSETAEAAGATAVPTVRAPAPPQPARARNTGAWIVAAIAVLVAGGSVGYMLLRDTPSPTAAQAADPAKPATADDAAMQVFGGMMDLMERGVAAQEKLAEPEPEAGAPAPVPAIGAVAELTPIPASELSNDDPERDIDMIAGPGEPLVPVALLGGMTPEQAVADFDNKAADHPDNPEWRVAQALVHLIAGNRKRGLAMLDDVLATWPNDAGAWAARGYVDLRLGKIAAAERSLSRAIELDPTDAQSLRNRGILRNRLGHTRDAYADLTAALEQDPEDVEAMSELAQIYERTDHRDDARPLLERIVRARPNMATAWLDLSLIQSPKQAIASIERAEKLEPNNRRVYKLKCTTATQLRDDRAIPACNKVLEITPDDPDGLMERGLAHYALGDTKRALADIDRAVKLQPNDTRFLQNRYIVRSHAGMTDGALTDLRKACKLGADVACTELKKLTAK
jgi:Flp pilus assembly protein TadD/tRNA A-37 threonylcarbamoyl transferase component Bud32